MDPSRRTTSLNLPPNNKIKPRQWSPNVQNAVESLLLTISNTELSTKFFRGRRTSTTSRHSTGTTSSTLAERDGQSTVIKLFERPRRHQLDTFWEAERETDEEEEPECSDPSRPHCSSGMPRNNWNFENEFENIRKSMEIPMKFEPPKPWNMEQSLLPLPVAKDDREDLTKETEQTPQKETPKGNRQQTKEEQTTEDEKATGTKLEQQIIESDSSNSVTRERFKRTKELAIPKERVDNHTRPQPYHVTEAAKNYKISDRINALAVPKKRRQEEVVVYLDLPMKVSPAALTAEASPRIIELAQPKGFSKKPQEEQ